MKLIHRLVSKVIGSAHKVIGRVLRWILQKVFDVHTLSGEEYKSLKGVTEFPIMKAIEFSKDGTATRFRRGYTSLDKIVHSLFELLNIRPKEWYGNISIENVCNSSPTLVLGHDLSKYKEEIRQAVFKVMKLEETSTCVITKSVSVLELMELLLDKLGYNVEDNSVVERRVVHESHKEIQLIKKKTKKRCSTNKKRTTK